MGSSLGHKTIAAVAILYTSALTVGSLITPLEMEITPPDNTDKIVHATAYFGLMLLWSSWARLREVAKETVSSLALSKYLKILLFVILYGTLIEVLQGTLTEYRTPDVLDIVANTTGAILGLIVFVRMNDKLAWFKS